MDFLKSPRNSLERSASELHRLSWGERWTLLHAFVLLPKLAIWLRLVGFRRLRALLSHLISDPETAGGEGALDRARGIARLVAAAAARQPVSISCLPRSLTLWYLLGRQGFFSEIRLGVRHQGTALEAHAWVEMEGEVLNDSADVHERYAAFDPIEWPDGAKWV